MSINFFIYSVFLYVKDIYNILNYQTFIYLFTLLLNNTYIYSKNNIMRIDLIRYNSTDNYTDGMLLIDGKFQCYTIEDEGRTKKVYGETRIPNGLYDVTFRKEGRFHNKYSTKFDFHKGMLSISNAPDFKLITKDMEFQYILIHIGNTDQDTAGCILVGQQANGDKNLIGQSTDAYKKFYPIIANALQMGDEVKINVQTLTPTI